jgi:hypothetical protein
MPDDSLYTPLHTLTADRTPYSETWLLKPHMQPAGNITHFMSVSAVANSIQLHAKAKSNKPCSKEYEMSEKWKIICDEPV